MRLLGAFKLDSSSCCATSLFEHFSMCYRPVPESKSKSHYDRQSVGQSVLVSRAHLGPLTNFGLLPIPLRLFQVCYLVTPSLARGLVSKSAVSAGSRQRRPSRVWVPRDWRPYFIFPNFLNSVNLVVKSSHVTLQLTVSQSVCLGVESNLGLLTRDIFFSLKVTVLSYLWRPLWREVGSVICQSFVILVCSSISMYIQFTLCVTHRAMFPYLYPPGTGCPSFTPGH
jgi:hypothetical protein